MAKQVTCHTCVYAHWDRGLWMRSLTSGFPSRPTCGNQPDSPGRMKECPCATACRNYRARPPVPEGESVRTIPLGDGLYAYVDAENFEWLNQWHWRAYGNGYAVRWEKRRLIYMHREIMRPPPGKVVDHISGNRFDNTLANMRNITPQQNMCNMRKHVGATSIYKGVSYNKRRRRWCARIRFGKENFCLGYFDIETDAARAYDLMAVKLCGEFARLNFPEEWPPKRRARVHAQWLKENRKTRSGKKTERKKRRATRGRRKSPGKKAARKVNRRFE